MASRGRYLVALTVGGNAAHEIDALRRALGSRDLERIAPHITLIPPINIAGEAITQAIEIIRAAANATKPIDVTLGPATTFDHRGDVVFLQVGDDGQKVQRLRDALGVAPLLPAERDVRPFHPHVTVATRCEPALINAAVATFASFALPYVFTEIALLEQQDAMGHPWEIVATFPFFKPHIVGRGGRAIEFSLTSTLDPVARQFFDTSWDEYRNDSYGEDAPAAQHFALTARISGTVVGVALGSIIGADVDLDRLIVDKRERNLGVGSQLLRRVEQMVHDGGGGTIRLVTQRDGQARRLYVEHGYAVVATIERFRHGRAFVIMERNVPVP